MGKESSDNERRPTTHLSQSHERQLVEAAWSEAFVYDGVEIAPNDLRDGQCPRQIGPYRITRHVSTGGMARVFEAEQSSPRRTVALKVIKTTELSPRGLDRFEHEAQLLARLQHPGIAQVYDLGTFPTPAGVFPYIAMEFVAGCTLLDYAEMHELDRRRRLELLESVCHAVQHAHHKGIVHRDLKPANIVVDAAGQPKVLDFGIARVIDPSLGLTTMHTQVGEPIGTIPYMSPEQVIGDPDRIDTRCDVYSLGVVAHELLSGQLPYDIYGKPRPEAFRSICEAEPTRLGRHDPALRGDVETIVLKALEKDPDRRYQSAGEFAADIRRFLDHEPILARSSGWWERFWRWRRRNPALALLALVAVVLALAVVVGSATATWMVARARQVAVDQAQRRQRSLYAAQMSLAMLAFERHDVATTAALLEAHRPAPGQDDLRSFEWYYLWRRLHGEHAMLKADQGRVRSIAFSDDGRWLASAGNDERILLWDTQTWQVANELTGHSASIDDLAFAPGGSWLASASQDRSVKLWEVPSGAQLATFHGHERPPQCLAFSPDGRWLMSGGPVTRPGHPITASHGEILIWDLAEKRKARRISQAEMRREMTSICDATFLADGRLLTISWASRAELWDIHSGKCIGAVNAPVSQLIGCAANPSARSIVLGGWDRSLCVCAAANLELEAMLPAQPVSALALDSTGRLLATADFEDHYIDVWDLRTKERVDRLYGHLGSVRCLAFQPHTQTLASGSIDGSIRLWDCRHRHGPVTLGGHAAQIGTTALSADGRLLATGGRDGVAKLWDLETGTERLSLPGHWPWVSAIALSPDRRRLATTGTHDRTVFVWDVETGTRRALLYDRPSAGFGALAFSPAGKLLAAGGTRPPNLDHFAGLTVWDTDTWQVRWAKVDLPTDAAASVAFSPDGSLIAAGFDDGTIGLFHPETGDCLQTLSHSGRVICLAFSADGTLLAGGAWIKDELQDRLAEARLFEMPTGRLRHILPAHRDAVAGIAFSPDRKVLATGGDGGTVKLWDLVSGELRATFHMPKKGWVFGLTFTPDGRTLITTSGSTTESGEIILLHAASPEEAYLQPP